jgi:hypothetical protein
MGSKLNYQSKQELNKIAAILDANKAIEFEIIGHVCCTLVTLTQSIGKLRSDGCKSRQICFPLSNE